MRLKVFGIGAVSVLDLLLLIDLVNGFQVLESAAVWCSLHVACCLTGTVLLSQIYCLQAGRAAPQVQADQLATGHIDVLKKNYPDTSHHVHMLALVLALFLPGVGLLCVSFALFYGLKVSQDHSHTSDYWQITPVASLPSDAPSDRKIKPVDSRGFTEHLLYSMDNDDIYQKVCSSANVGTSLAVETLRQATQHCDEKVRLAAYKTIDEKETILNKEIQRLQHELATGEEGCSSERWLQIASNYWELATLEGEDGVGRKQLLSKASSAAIKAVLLFPESRNAHLVLGRICLAQGNTRRASGALERAQVLGMPEDKVLPYLAECAYLDRNFPRVQRLLSELAPSIVAYPPLSHVARYWA